MKLKTKILGLCILGLIATSCRCDFEEDETRNKTSNQAKDLENNK